MVRKITLVFRNFNKMERPNNFPMVRFSLNPLFSVVVLVAPLSPLDYISEVLKEDADTDPKLNKEDWDSPITFTAKSSRKCFNACI